MLKHARAFCVWLFGCAAVLGSRAALADKVDHWKFNMTPGVTPVSHDAYHLHMQMFWWCVGIAVVVFGVMFVSMFLHRKSRGAVPANFHENVWLEALWTIVPIIILVIMVIPASKSLINLYNTDDSAVEVKITGYQWHWKYEILGEGVSFFSNIATPQDQIKGFAPKDKNYLLQVDEPLVLPVHKKIHFLVTSHDVIHSWWVPAFAVKRDAIPGYVHDSWATIEKTGIYRGQCAELCGKGHGFMPIVVDVRSEAGYQAWLKKKKASAAAVAALTQKTFSFDELYKKGQQVFGKNCAVCHQANGQGIPGSFPALKGSSVATGPIKNHINTVLHGVKGTAMQAFGEQLSEVDIAAVITYERNAWGNNMGDMAQPIDIYNQKHNK